MPHGYEVVISKLHTECSFEPAELCVIGTGIFEGLPFRHIKFHIIQIGDLEFCKWVSAFRTDHFVAVQHEDAVTTFTIVHVHHKNSPFLLKAHNS